MKLKILDGQTIFVSYIIKYENGNIQHAKLSKKTTIKTPVGKLKFNNNFISFYKNGKLNSGQLAKSKKINGIKYEKNDTIKFTEQGKVKLYKDRKTGVIYSSKNSFWEHEILKTKK